MLGRNLFRINEMSKKLNLIGQKINNLLVLEDAPTKNGKTYSKCQCTLCDSFCIIMNKLIKSGHTKSCGCLHGEKQENSTSNPNLFKRCSGCEQIKSHVEFQKNNTQKDGLQNICRECKRHYHNGIKKTDFKDYFCIICDIEIDLGKYCDNCLIIHQKENAKIYARNKRTDPCVVLRENISRSIKYALKTRGLSKNRHALENFLPYSIQELKDHLEKQFEPWMSWENWGLYRLEDWDDNDPKTWTWHIDHIIPHSAFHYKTMEDQSFKDCWALDNLRPLNAKQNITDNDRGYKNLKKDKK